jgi:uncharacterized protein YjbJ (UPF0337 family)
MKRLPSIKSVGESKKLFDVTITWSTEVSQREENMKSSTKDQAEGTYHKMKGKMKEVAGELSDNPKLEAEGIGEKIAGIVQEKIGQVKKVLGK